jgi:O-antigen/teichoic acid export membrane protein
MEKQGKYKYLAKNIGLLTLSSFATKLLSFFLVPLYTSILTTADYGTYDLFNTTVGVLLPILTLNVQEGVIRFAMEKDYDREAIVTIGIRHLLIGSAITATGLVVNSLFGFSPMLKT